MNDQSPDPALFGIGGVRKMRLAEVDAAGTPFVGPENGQPLPARSLVPLDRSLIGQEVAVVPFAGDPYGLLVIGVLQPAAPVAAPTTRVIEAEDKLVLRCGQSSLTMTSDGRVTVRARQILSRADGQNRVQGANVSLN